MAGGAVSGGLKGAGVWLNCCELGTGVTVELTLEQAERVGFWLLELVKTARLTQST